MLKRQGSSDLIDDTVIKKEKKEAVTVENHDTGSPVSVKSGYDADETENENEDETEEEGLNLSESLKHSSEEADSKPYDTDNVFGSEEPEDGDTPQPDLKAKNGSKLTENAGAQLYATDPKGLSDSDKSKQVDSHTGVACSDPSVESQSLESQSVDSQSVESPPVRDLPKKVAAPRRNNPGKGSGAGAPFHENAPFMQLRILVDSREAGEIIGRKGSVLSSIRDEANVRLKVSSNYPGAQERLIIIKGKPEEVAKATGLITRVFKKENFGEASSADSEPYTMRLVIPHCMMGCLIGKGGLKFREIEEASSAQLKALEKKLPFSSDRILTVYGVADAIHLAIYYIWHTYTTHLDSNMRTEGYDAYNPEVAFQRGVAFAVPPGGPSGGPSGGLLGPSISGNMQGTSSGFSGFNQNYSSQGFNGQSQNYSTGNSHQMQQSPYQRQPSQHQQYQDHQNKNGSSYTQGQGNIVRPQPPMVVGDESLYQAQRAAQDAPPDQSLISTIRIPERYVGSIIGKGGAKIKEIRRVSGSDVQVGEKEPNADKRSLTITGLPTNNQLAIYLIHQKIENDKTINSRTGE